jgi:DNA-nicking Smr family endonuclease
MSRRPRGLSDDERVLWSTVTRSIAPLKGRKAVKDAADAAAIEARPKAKPAATAPAATAAAQRAAPPPLAPMDRRTKQRLARGTTEIGGRLDLHGLTQAEAHAALARFLRNAQARDVKVVLVITGKGGAAAEGRGVLKRQVPHWLEGVEFRSLVVGFESAGIGHGGAGALYVRVRKGRS